MGALLLDSSNTSLSVGYESNGSLLDFTSYEAWQVQSEHMIPEIDKLMEKLNLSRNDIDKVVVSIGPGSYTGVRIALTIAKVMALALDIPVYTVSSLRVLKDSQKPSICVINARSNRSYVGVFDKEKVIITDTIMTNDEVKEYITNHPDFVVCGDARYLGYNNVDNNICLQMVNLLPFLTKEENSLSIKPVYMKD